MRRTLTSVGLVMLVVRGAEGQVPPDVAELARLRAVVDAREVAAAMALRRRWRVFVGLGVVGTSPFDVTTASSDVRFEGGFGGALSATLTRGLTELFDVFARVDVVAPLRASALPASARRDVAATPCAGSRRFELSEGAGGLAGLDLGLRLRVLDARSPFFVGFALRVAGRWNDVAGAWRVTCEGSDGVRTLLAQGRVAGVAPVLDLGATLEAGYRFGATGSWELGLRLSLGGIAEGDINARVGQWYVAWTPW